MMKNKNVLKFIAAGLLILVLIVGSAWRSKTEMDPVMDKSGHPKGQFLNLNDNQKEQVKSFRLKMLKDVTPMMNELNVFNAQLKAQSVGDNIDEKAVFQLMEKISALQLKITKRQFQFEREFRTVLTDDQKILFDADGGLGKGPEMGMNPEMRKGPDMGKEMKGGQGRDMNMRDKKPGDRPDMPMIEGTPDVTEEK